jgi:predicted lipid-binding transport protein (Tim44 family)
MFLLVKRFFKQIALTAIIGFVIRKLMASNDPRAKRIGDGANKLVGGAFGQDEHARPRPRRRTRRVARSAATAAAGGAMSYFFDPVQGPERRAKVKRFASERIHRNGETHLLPSASQIPTAVPTQAIAPGVPS